MNKKIRWITETAALLALFSSFRLPRVWADLGAKSLVLLVFCDVGYTAYFHSFYGEPLQTVGLLLMAAFGLRTVLRSESQGLNFLFFCLDCIVNVRIKFLTECIHISNADFQFAVTDIK